MSIQGIFHLLFFSCFKYPHSEDYYSFLLSERESISILLSCFLVKFSTLCVCPGIIQADPDFEIRDSSWVFFFLHILISDHATVSIWHSGQKINGFLSYKLLFLGSLSVLLIALSLSSYIFVFLRAPEHHPLPGNDLDQN